VYGLRSRQNKGRSILHSEARQSMASNFLWWILQQFKTFQILLKAVDRTNNQFNLILTIRVFVLSACSFRHDFFFLVFPSISLLRPSTPTTVTFRFRKLHRKRQSARCPNYVWICACNSNLASQQASSRPCLRHSCIVTSPVRVPVSPPYFPSAFIIPVLDFIRSQI
jgi:hypothetical protein